MRTPITVVTLALVPLILASHVAVAQERDDRAFRPRVPTITVTGHGEATAPPDRAVLTLGATAQAEQARDAQDQVNGMTQGAFKRLTELGVPQEHITTASLELSPVYNEHPVVPAGPDGRAPPAPPEPPIVAYRASSTVQAEVTDLGKVPEIVDGVVAAGANQLQGISFQRKDDAAQRRDALRRAAQDAESKASALADALGVRLGGVQQVSESGVRAMSNTDFLARTPLIQPGQIHVQADVTIEYRIVEAAEGAKSGR